MMAAPRIDVVDPSVESLILVEALRGRGFTVRERPLASLEDGCDADLLLLAADAPGALDILAGLHAGEFEAPVILLGRPLEMEDEGAEVTSIRRFDAGFSYPRPLPIAEVLRKVETLLSAPNPGPSPVSSDAREDGGDDAEEAAADAGDAERDHPRPESSPEQSDVIVGPKGAGWKPHERTVTLGDDAPSEDSLGDFFEDAFDADDRGKVSEVTGVTFKEDLLSIEEAAAGHDPNVPVSQVARREDSRRDPAGSTQERQEQEQKQKQESAVVLSPRLAKIFSEADRRIFPDSPALDLELPDHQESARELVPDDLLEVVSLPTETREEDPLEAFTYVGAPPEHVGAPLPMPEAAQRYQSKGNTGEDGPSPARPARTEAGSVAESQKLSRTEVEDAREPSRPVRTLLQPEPSDVGTSPESVPGTPSSSEQTQDHFAAGEFEQVGVASEEEVLRILFSVAASKASIDARFERPDGTALELSVADGRLTRLGGSIHVRAIEELYRQGRIGEVPPEEARAAVVLDAHVAAGTIGRFEADRLLRRAREAEIHDLIAEATVSYDVTRAGGLRAGDPGILTAPLAVVITEGARRRISRARFRQLMGGGALVVDVRKGLDVIAARLGIEPEVAGVVTRHDGANLDDLLAAAPDEEGLAGVLYALWATGAVGITAGAAAHKVAEDPAQAHRSVIEAAYAIAEDGSYFDVLGVPPDVMLRELRAAYVEKRRQLRRIDLDAHALTGLGPERLEALDVVEEAWEVLRDEGVRAAYRRALGL